MQLLNTPVGLNSIEDFILKNIPENAECGVIVHAGDGRLGKSIQERFSKKIKVYNVEEHEKLYKSLPGSEKSRDIWNVEWYQKLSEENKGIDFICFINIHEYWDGNLYELQSILNCLKPEGVGFISFYNKNSMYAMRQALPPFANGYEQLANPMNIWAKVDLLSWIIYLLDIGLIVDNIWGMLEEKGFNYCKEGLKGEVTWQYNNLSLKVKDASEAFIYSAPVLCMRF
ncbi:MAG: hypothetical protein C5B43_04655, partial [Verrucomicrobia bacterium]